MIYRPPVPRFGGGWAERNDYYAKFPQKDATTGLLDLCEWGLVLEMRFLVARWQWFESDRSIGGSRKASLAAGSSGKKAEVVREGGGCVLFVAAAD